MSRVIHSWRDLEEFGIDPLTGEACGLALRILCDVTAKGKELVERFLGNTVAIKIDSQWNGGDRDDPHVGSIMLPYGILAELGAFCLTMTGSATVAIMKDGSARELRAGHPEDHVKRYVRRSTSPGTGDRNQHAVSGRLE